MRITPVLAILALAAAGCSSSTSKPTALPAPAAAVDGTSSAPAAIASSPAPAAPAKTTAAVKLKIGGTATLSTPTGPLEVTLVKMVDPAKPKESYIFPTKGEHWVGLQFRFVNKGTAPFTDSPLVGLAAADAQGQPQTSFPDQDIAAGPIIDVVAGLSMQPGDTTLGYLVYSVPDGTKIARIGFTPPGGSAAQWSLS